MSAPSSGVSNPDMSSSSRFLAPSAQVCLWGAGRLSVWRGHCPHSWHTSSPVLIYTPSSTAWVRWRRPCLSLVLYQSMQRDLWMTRWDLLWAGTVSSLRHRLADLFLAFHAPSLLIDTGSC